MLGSLGEPFIETEVEGRIQMRQQAACGRRGTDFLSATRAGRVSRRTAPFGRRFGRRFHGFPFSARRLASCCRSGPPVPVRTAEALIAAAHRCRARAVCAGGALAMMHPIRRSTKSPHARNGNFAAADMMAQEKRFRIHGAFGENILEEGGFRVFDPAGFAERAVAGWMSSPATARTPFPRIITVTASASPCGETVPLRPRSSWGCPNPPPRRRRLNAQYCAFNTASPSNP